MQTETKPLSPAAAMGVDKKPRIHWSVRAGWVSFAVGIISSWTLIGIAFFLISFTLALIAIGNSNVVQGILLVAMNLVIGPICAYYGAGVFLAIFGSPSHAANWGAL
jgi:hypothetical protein